MAAAASPASAASVVAAAHAAAADAVIEALAGSRQGLTQEEAERRLLKHGSNMLPAAPRRSPVARFLVQLRNVLIYVLLAAAVITALLGHWIDSGVILAVVLINAMIGFIQEGKAEQALSAIRSMLSPRAQVRRDGHLREIPAECLVPGDIVFVASGDRIPADLRLIEARNLHVDESMLTGESMAVEKCTAAQPQARELGDRRCMAYSGTLLTSGQGTGIVTATGRATEIGRISAMLEQSPDLTTPLLGKLKEFSRALTWTILAAASLMFLYGWRVKGNASGDMFLAAVGLAIAAIPEGLPAIITIALAIGVQRMARRQAIIRRLPAVEALGAVTVICSDKTGTLTRNEMAVQQIITADSIFAISGRGYDPHGSFMLDGMDVKADDYPILRAISQAALLCNDAGLYHSGGEWQISGDPTEGALLTLARKAGLDQAFEAEALPRVDAIPFESEHRFMATLHHDHAGRSYVFLKGAPERVLQLCHAQRVADVDMPLQLSQWHERLELAATAGMRLLAVAVRIGRASHAALEFADVESGGFTLLAVLGISDPPREEAIRALAACRAAGIRVKMITGDHAITASAIGRQLGLADNVRTIAGASLDEIDDARLQELAINTEVFARASPEHKLRLVRALQARGEVVAMTGDGVNDAPALKQADVGVAMGRKGTEAAKQASEIVLADDNFASIVAAVEEGRNAYDNIRKAILFILPTNGGEAGIIMIAVLLGITLPITPVQILWVNMITAVTLSLAMAFEQAEANIMRQPPRNPREPLLSRFLTWRIVLVSVLLVGGSLGMFMWEIEQGMGVNTARCASVNTLVAGEIAYLFNCRHINASALNWNGIVGNRYALIAVASLLAFQLLFTYWPVMQELFGTGALSLASWGRIGGFGMALFVVIEMEKSLFRRGSIGARARLPEQA